MKGTIVVEVTTPLARRIARHLPTDPGSTCELSFPKTPAGSWSCSTGSRRSLRPMPDDPGYPGLAQRARRLGMGRAVGRHASGRAVRGLLLDRRLGPGPASVVIDARVRSTKQRACRSLSSARRRAARSRPRSVDVGRRRRPRVARRPRGVGDSSRRRSRRHRITAHRGMQAGATRCSRIRPRGHRSSRASRRRDRSAR